MIVGDTVRLTTDRYGNCDVNPCYDKTGVEGEVTDIEEGTIYVKWDNGRNNVYVKSDLGVILPIIDVDDLFSEIEI